MTFKVTFTVKVNGERFYGIEQTATVEATDVISAKRVAAPVVARQVARLFPTAEIQVRKIGVWTTTV